MPLNNIISIASPPLDNQGNIIPGGLVHLYEPNTTTFVPAFKNSALTIPHQSPIRLTGSGRGSIWVNRDCDMFIFDRNGVLKVSEKSVNPSDSGESTSSGLITNGSFEIDDDADTIPDGWELSSEAGASNAIDSTESTDGAQSFRFTSSGNGGGSLVTGNFFSVNDLDALRVNVDLKSTITGVRNIVRVEWYDISFVSISNSDIYDSTSNPTVFTTQNLSASPPAGARFAKLRLIGVDPSVAIAGTTYFDRVVVFYPQVVVGVFDNITVQNNEIITTNPDGDLNLRPNGSGAVVIDYSGSVKVVSRDDGWSILTDVPTSTPPSTEVVRGAFSIWDAENNDRLADLGFLDSNALQVSNNMEGGGVLLAGKDLAGTLQPILAGAGNGATAIFNSGNQRISAGFSGVASVHSDGDDDLEDRILSFDHQAGARTAMVGHQGSGDFLVKNQIEGGHVALQGTLTGGGVEDLLTGDPDGETSIYHSGSKRLSASAGGVATLYSNGNTDSEGRYISLAYANGLDRANIGFTSFSDLVLSNKVHGGRVLLHGEDSGGFASNILVGDPNEGVALYDSGVAVARTVSISEGGFEAKNGVTGSGDYERVLTTRDLGLEVNAEVVLHKGLAADRVYQEEITSTVIPGFTVNLGAGSAGVAYNSKSLFFIDSEANGSNPGFVVGHKTSATPSSSGGMWHRHRLGSSSIIAAMEFSVSPFQLVSLDVDGVTIGMADIFLVPSVDSSTVEITGRQSTSNTLTTTLRAGTRWKLEKYS